ncbi:MAG TPA: lysylphosphatidylglycerol synthase transmembrane domain-containing protein [Thermoguttaceae bacterium]
MDEGFVRHWMDNCRNLEPEYLVDEMKKTIVTLLKVSISVGLIAYLIWDATRGQDKVNVFANLRDQPKNWWILAGAWAVSTAAVLLTFIRWWYLVRALEIPCRFSDAIRISFWGFLFNLAPLGIVGGDLVKAFMLAHEHRRYRARAIASVLFDRALGLYILFVVASVAILLTGFWRIDVPEIRMISQATFIITIAGTLGIVLLLMPGVTDGRLSRAIGRLPRVGHILASLIDAVRMYRRKPIVLFVSSLMCIGVMCLFSIGIYLIARGLPGEVLSLGLHFVVMPLSAAVGVLPLPLGPFEFVLEFLYTHVPQAGASIAKGQGLVVALAYRLITVLIAALGIYYYLGNRREVADAIHEEKEIGTI